MNRITAVFQSESVTIERFDHPRHYVHCDHDLEATRDVAVTFVERGRFSIHEGKEFWHFQHRDVLVSVPTMYAFRYRSLRTSSKMGSAGLHPRKLTRELRPASQQTLRDF